MRVEDPGAMARDASVRAVVVVVSSTSAPEAEAMGKRLAARLAEVGFAPVDRRAVVAERRAIAAAVQEAVGEGARLVLTTGGTGVSARDVTPEAVEPLFRTSIPGFGELLRVRWFREQGATAMRTRATAGIVQSSVVFVLPASPEACALALDELVMAEIPRLLEQLDAEPAPPPNPVGWERSVTDGTVERGPRPPIPPSLAGFGPSEQLLAESSEAARLDIAGQHYTLWGFPDLGPRSRVIAVGDGAAIEVVALHRHHPTGVGGSPWWAPPGDLEARVHAVVGHPLPISGTWFGCTSDAVFVESEGRVCRFDGRRTTDLGTRKQALATLLLEFARR
ncbi:MAG: molybdopterin-binding protein [Myxococcota bacterium]